MSSKDSKSSARYQSPISQQKTERRTEDFSSPITQWLSSPFCQLDILSPNDGSLAFSISSPVQLSPYLPANHATSKSPGTFSPSIFSSYKETAYFEDNEAINMKSDRNFENDHDLDDNNKVGLGLFAEPTSNYGSGQNLSHGNALKKSSLYGRLDRQSDRSAQHVDSSAPMTMHGQEKDGYSISSAILSGVALGRNRNELYFPSDSIIPSSEESSSPGLSQSMRNQRASQSRSTGCNPGRPRTASSNNISMESNTSDLGGNNNSTMSSSSLTVNTEDLTKCNCKKSKCLKLYCECFVGMKYCGDNCRCRDCYNNLDHDSQRQEAIRITKTRNGAAFQAKVSPALKVHMNGCNCKQSQCLKKYCECFTGAALCGTNCKCLSCQNFSGSETLLAARRQLNESTPVLSANSNPGRSLNSPDMRFAATRAHSNEPQEIASSSSMMLDYDHHGVDIFDESFAVPNSTAGEDYNESAKSEMDTVEDAYRSRKRFAADGSMATDMHSMEQSARSLVSRATRSAANKIALSSSLEAAVPGQVRMNTRGLVRHGSIPPPGGDHSDSAPISAEHKSKARRIGNGTSPSGITDLPLVISPMGLQFDSASADSSSHKLLGHAHGFYLSSQNDGTYDDSSLQAAKRRDNSTVTDIVYPFFGEAAPSMPKIIALRCLEFLDGPSLYNTSLVSTLWCKAAMDDALWE